MANRTTTYLDTLCKALHLVGDYEADCDIWSEQMLEHCSAISNESFVTRMFRMIPGVSTYLNGDRMGIFSNDQFASLQPFELTVGNCIRIMADMATDFATFEPYYVQDTSFVDEMLKLLNELSWLYLTVLLLIIFRRSNDVLRSHMEAVNRQYKCIEMIASCGHDPTKLTIDERRVYSMFADWDQGLQQTEKRSWIGGWWYGFTRYVGRTRVVRFLGRGRVMRFLWDQLCKWNHRIINLVPYLLHMLLRSSSSPITDLLMEEGEEGVVDIKNLVQHEQLVVLCTEHANNYDNEWCKDNLNALFNVFDRFENVRAACPTAKMPNLRARHYLDEVLEWDRDFEVVEEPKVEKKKKWGRGYSRLPPRANQTTRGQPSRSTSAGDSSRGSNASTIPSPSSPGEWKTMNSSVVSTPRSANSYASSSSNHGTRIPIVKGCKSQPKYTPLRQKN